MQIAILGAGALGSVIGGLLAANGRDVSLWDLNARHIAAIRDNGLTLDGPEGRIVVQVPAMRPDEATQTPDLIILLTKTIHTEAALRGIQRHLDAGAHVLTLQNGLGNAERIAAIVPRDAVLYGCTLMPGRFIGPGHVASQGNGFAVFKGLTDRGSDFGRKIAFAGNGLKLEMTEDTDRIIWEKAAFNCAMNAVTALAGARVGQLNAPETLDLLRRISAEVVAVAQARGIGASHDAVMTQIGHALGHHADHKPSMLQDLEAGRPTEIDSLCGEVDRLARRDGIDAPLNRLLAELVRLKSRIVSDEH